MAVGQSGTIPFDAKTLTFWGDNPAFVVTFSGQVLSYAAIASTTSYSIYAADISAFAGQTGELLFTTPAGPRALLDNIQFSNILIPEPGILSLVVVGASVLLIRRSRVR